MQNTGVKVHIKEFKRIKMPKQWRTHYRSRTSSHCITDRKLLVTQYSFLFPI